ncbi:MAG TPA: hypothetical protein VFM93_01485 [Candidatus Limnocylindria bacterium]|nr:hypothetical protein [Candidatus Limnocylindria bacterium]
MPRAIALRLAAAAATVVALLGSTAYVAANPKNPAAPLQPPVAKPAATPTPRPTGRIQLAPGVQATSLPGITFTHVS